MASINSIMGLSWAVVGNNLLPFIPYVSIAAVDADQSSRIPTEPIEKGQLAAYNIVREPERVNVEFLFNGSYAVQVLALAMLDRRMNSTASCTIFSPAKIWRNMALEHYDFSRTQTSNACMLSIHASFVESKPTENRLFAKASDFCSQGKHRAGPNKTDDGSKLDQMGWRPRQVETFLTIWLQWW